MSMKIKDIKEIIAFTKQSILYVSIFLIGLIFYIVFKFGFEEYFIRSVIAISVLALVNIIYIIWVLILYYKFPKNKDSKKYGVLFIIETFNNNDYETLKNKFCEKFKQLSAQSQSVKIESIIPTLKNVSTLKNKNLSEGEIQKELLKKTNCTFGVFMKATDHGINNTKYDLYMNASVEYPNLKTELQDLLLENLNFVIRNIKLNALDKNDDLRGLQTISSKLHVVCQLIYGACHEYSKDYVYAIRLYKDLLNKISSEKGAFYKEIFSIVNCEICASVSNYTVNEQINYIYNEEYDFILVDEMLKIMKESLKNSPKEKYFINYHLAKAVYYLLTDKIVEAKGEISILSKRYKKYPPNKQSWLFSDACLTACENNPQTYIEIQRKYYNLRNSTSQNPKAMFDFLQTYSVKHENNLGVKLAMFFIVMYRTELPASLLDEKFKSNLMKKLKLIKQEELYEVVKQTKKINNS